MEFILKQLETLDFDTDLFLKSAVLLAIGSILLGAVGRFVFGKRSNFLGAVSSAIAILFIYAVTIAMQCSGLDFRRFIVPLPFIEIVAEELRIFAFQSAEFTEICAQVLSLVILAFLVNILDGILPRGKNFFVWLFLRILTVAGSMILHTLSSFLLLVLLPGGFLQYAPIILLALLAVLLLVGGLKIIVGAVLTTVNPIIGILYTFFFANIVGKAITKAILTGGIVSALVYLLEYVGITVIPLLSEALVLYIPFALILLIVWFVIGKLFDR
jgi:hypothetical protein